MDQDLATEELELQFGHGGEAVGESKSAAGGGRTPAPLNSATGGEPRVDVGICGVGSGEKASILPPAGEPGVKPWMTTRPPGCSRRSRCFNSATAVKPWMTGSC